MFGRIFGFGKVYSAEYSDSAKYIRQNIRIRQKSLFGTPLKKMSRASCLEFEVYLHFWEPFALEDVLRTDLRRDFLVHEDDVVGEQNSAESATRKAALLVREATVNPNNLKANKYI